MTMIERVARAIAAADGEDYMEDYRQFDKWAIAAIAAMREPTEGMIEAAYDAASMDDRWHIEDARHYRHAHSAAIDAALEEKP